MLLFAVRAKGQDFSVELTYGNTLYFTITNAESREVKVVAPSHTANEYTKPSGALSIPGEVTHEGKTYRVTAIGESAFSGCTELIMVMLPPTIERIEAYAFNGCSGLNERVTIGRKVKTVGNSAFYGCYNLPEVNFLAESCDTMGGSMSTTVFGNCHNLKRLIVGEGVSRIPDYAFCGLDGLKTMTNLPQSLRYVGNYAFAYCSSLTGNVIIPDKVEEIGECAFHQCHSLKALSLGSTVRRIGEKAFYHCIGLTRVEMKSYTPPEITSRTFADLSNVVTFSVPCVSKERYLRNEQWQAFAPFASWGQCNFKVKVTMDNPAAGIIVGNGAYTYGDTVNLMVVCVAGYSFDCWSDGRRDNPRRFIIDNNLTLTAQTHGSEMKIVHDTVYRVDTVYVKGQQARGGAEDFMEGAVSINESKELTFDKEKKRLKWEFPKEETVVNVSLYNQMGECVYTGDGRRGSFKMSRLSSGVYIVRVETLRRVVCCRFFMNSER